METDDTIEETITMSKGVSMEDISTIMENYKEPIIALMYRINFGDIPEIEQIAILHHGTSIENLQKMVFVSGGFVDASQEGETENYFSFDPEVSARFGGKPGIFADIFADDGFDGIILDFNAEELLKAGIVFKLGRSIWEKEFITDMPVPLKYLTIEAKCKVFERLVSDDSNKNKILAKALGYLSFSKLRLQLQIVTNISNNL